MNKQKTTMRIKIETKVPISFRSVLAKMRQKGAYSARLEGGGMEIDVNSQVRHIVVKDRAMLPIDEDYSERAVNYYLDRMRLESHDRKCTITYRLPPEN
jgi:hypothetical protein